MLAGGGSLGAVEVGMLEALVEAGVQADLVVGSSVGAINGAHFAAHPDRDGLERLRRFWTQVRRSDVFPFRPWNGLLSVLSLRNHLVDPGPLRRLLARALPGGDLRDTRLPLHVIATDALTGFETLLSDGSLVEAVLASSAIPGVFPPVERDRRLLMDGGIASNTPIAAAVALGARRVIVLPTGTACRLAEPPASAIGMALQGLTLLIGRQLAVDLERFSSRAELHVIPPPCPIERSPADFSGSVRLMDAGRAAARKWLAQGGLEKVSTADALAPHVHLD